VLVEGDLPDGRNRRGSIELYDSARFFTVTGDPVEEMSDRIARRQDALDAIHRDYVQEESHDRNEADSESTPETGSVDLDDVEVLEKARKAENGEKFEHLWKGHTAGYDSHSEADMALCCLLAFWTGGDRSQMDRLFRQSGLMREKWDETHYADGSTYGEKTIERALSTVTEHYDPDATTQPTPTAPLSGSSDQRKIDNPANSAYLAERNRLLKQRVNELRTKLEQKKTRIEALEDELR
jgi:primase-polymerase (primpol)-like protein